MKKIRTDRLVLIKSARGFLIYSKRLFRQGENIGHIFFHAPYHKHGQEGISNRKDNIGYNIEQEQRGRGYAGEALRAVTKYRIKKNFVPVLEIDDSNINSIRVAEKEGFCPIEENKEPVGYKLYVPEGLATNIKSKKLVLIKNEEILK